MSELSAKYKLSEDGNVISVEYSNGLPPSDVEKEVSEASKERFLKFQKNKSTNFNNNQEVSSFMNEMKGNALGIAGGELFNFDFITDPLASDDPIDGRYEIDFNSIFADDIYATEMEMLSGVNASEIYTSLLVGDASQTINKILH